MLQIQEKVPKASRTRAQYQVNTTWSEGHASESVCIDSVGAEHAYLSHQIRILSDEPPGHFTMLIDKPPIQGGRNSAPNPQEQTLVAFNACIMSALIDAATQGNVSLTRLEIHTSGDLSLNAQSHYGNQEPGAEKICYTILVAGDALRDPLIFKDSNNSKYAGV